MSDTSMSRTLRVLFLVLGLGLLVLIGLQFQYSLFHWSPYGFGVGLRELSIISVMLILFLAVGVAIGTYVYRDAKRRGRATSLPSPPFAPDMVYRHRGLVRQPLLSVAQFLVSRGGAATCLRIRQIDAHRLGQFMEWSLPLEKKDTKGNGRTNWLDESSDTPLIGQYVERLKSFLDAMADGRIEAHELKAQEDRVVALMKAVEPIHKEYEARLGKDLLDMARNPK